MKYRVSNTPLTLLVLALLGLSWVLAPDAGAGGSGLNTVIVVNQASTNSVELGNYYSERRGIPSDNLLRISWTGTNTSWASTDFQTNLLQPLLEMLADRQLTNQVDYVVLSMDIPFQTVNGSTVNSTTSALFYGLKPDGSGSKGNLNSYAASEAVFRLAQPATAPGYSFLTTMITGNTLAKAKQVVDQGVSGDGSFPSQAAVLEKTSDAARNVRYTDFDNAIFNVRLLGRSILVRTNSDSPPASLPVLGYQTGLASLTLPPNTFVPGAVGDNLTSFGGVIFGANGQTSLLAFLEAGAAGSYGTVDEPLSDPQKFPNPQVYFYQSRGFNLAEAYYQSVNAPFLGLLVGEPLAAPFARPASGTWLNVASNAILTGTSQLLASFSSQKGSPPLQQIDLFVDGKLFQTLTNFGPAAGNQLTLKLQGYPISYTVPANATLALVTTGMVAAINAPANTNLTKVKAYARGDRIELHSLSTNYQADPFYYLDCSATNGNFYYRVTYLPYPVVPQLTSAGLDEAGSFRMQIETTPGVPYTILASTNLTDWSAVATNLAGGEGSFVDSAVSNYAKRFFRVASPEQRPTLSLSASNSNATVNVHVQSQTSLPYLFEESTNLASWTALSTNNSGGSMDYVEPLTIDGAGRFYRATLSPPVPPPASLAVLPPPASTGNLIRITGAARAYTLDVSTNLGQWTSIFTNRLLVGGQTVTSTSSGAGEPLSTFLNASQTEFMESPAFGLRTFYTDGTPLVGSWLQLVITKTNNLTVWASVTNDSGGGTIASLTQALLAVVNSSPALQGPDGLIGEDFATDAFGSPSFHLRALSPGYNASRLIVTLRASTGLSISPSSQVNLNQNLSDLQPRNHLYLTAGAPTLVIPFSLDSTGVADGFHDLTVMAYEGTHVHTRSVASVPVQIQNSSLTAGLTLLDLSATNSVQGTYHIHVAANTNTVNSISLFSTGGLLAATNQAPATFSFDGTFLGPGLHPFYALVQTSDGLQYRTQTSWSRFVAGP